MRIRTLTVVVTAAGLALAGCGSSNSHSAAGSSAKSSTTTVSAPPGAAASGATTSAAAPGTTTAGAAANKPTTPRDQLVLGQADFPPGTQIQHPSTEQLGQATGSMGDAMKNATIDPPECKGSQQDLANATQAMLGQAAVAVATDMSKRATYLDSVIDGAHDLGTFKNSVVGRCGTVKASMTVDGHHIETTTHSTVHPVPSGLSGADAFAYETDSSVPTPAGGQQSMTALSGVANVRGMSVLVRASSLTGPVDAAAFDNVFTAAVRKVRNAP